jgi:hypothetical protein
MMNKRPTKAAWVERLAPTPDRPQRAAPLRGVGAPLAERSRGAVAVGRTTLARRAMEAVLLDKAKVEAPLLAMDRNKVEDPLLAMDPAKAEAPLLVMDQGRVAQSMLERPAERKVAMRDEAKAAMPDGAKAEDPWLAMREPRS